MKIPRAINVLIATIIEMTVITAAPIANANLNEFHKCKINNHTCR